MTDDGDGSNGRESARRTDHLFQPDLAESLHEAYAWVTRFEVEQFVLSLNTMRQERHDAMAMRALHAFALRRPVHELVELAHHFDGRDAVMLMATAALSRPVGEAAELALMQHEAESGGERAPITASIVHDVACQRTAFDVAVFVRVLQRRQPELAERTVQVFASPGSGRTNLDKALLHTALRDEGCHREADRLLELTLQAIADSPLGTAGVGAEDEEMADLSGAFQHLSPAGQILERWVEDRLNAQNAAEVGRTRGLVASLIARGGTDDALAEYIGSTVPYDHVVSLCALLSTGDTASPAKCAMVRRYAAGRESLKDLGGLVAAWHKEPSLTRTTRDLLADIAEGRTAPDSSPRSLEELEHIDEWLPQMGADPECSRLLRYEAAVRVEGRSGEDLVTLLGRVNRSRDKTRAQHEMGYRLAVAVMGPDADRDWFVDCLRALQAKHLVAVRSACRELSDPAGELDAGLVADVARRLHGAGLHDASWTLLERLLENEQRVTPPGVVEVVRQALALPDAELLVRATVGRWSDGVRRDEAVTALRAADQREAADWVIKSLR
ncbi:hypothetical protein [Streptomyces blattellae]|uniref:hypothetical protein n=1 Tax=Streptomyces blattellae TaxID=2569855 RepID=UPI0012B8F7AD|nr:hypothetical protein [Streptomyces blattellae]